MSPRLVGFAGPAGVGKSSAAELLAAEGGWRLVSFADPLRALALALHPEWTLVDVVGARKDEVRPVSPLGWTAMEDVLAEHVQALTGHRLDVWSRVFEWVPARVLSELQQAMSPRQTHRLLGDFIKSLYPSAFTQRAEQTSGMALMQGQSVVLDDVRFEPEAAMIRGLGGTVVHMQRDGVAFRRDHDSEMGVAVAAVDLHLVNRGDLRTLRGELYRVLGPGRRVREDAA